MKRRLVTALACTLGLGLATGCSLIVPDDGNSPATSSQQLVWRGCGSGESFLAGEAVEGKPECAYLKVPTDRANPAAGEQTLAVTRVQASGKRRGVLFVNPGGPGVAATKRVEGMVEAIPSEIAEAFDVVAMDPRAVGESGYLSCTDPQARSRKAPIDASPDDEAERAAFDASIARLGESCAQRQPSLVAHVSTQDFARDVDDLRAALGADQLDLLGYSYGTLLGYEYARLFPDRVHRMVLDGVVAPGASAAEATLARATAAEDALYSFAGQCVDEGCALGRTADDVLATIAAVQVALERKPVPVTGDPTTTAVDEGLFTATLFGALYAPEYAFMLADAIPPLRKADPAPFLELAGLLADAEGGIANNVVNGVYWATSCLDRPRAEVTDAARLAVLESSETFGRMLAADAGMCSQWPVPARPLAATPLPARVGAKTLIISNSADPATPRSGADQVAALLPKSAHLRVDIWGHTASFIGIDCVDNAVRSFLLSGDTSATRNGCSA